MPGQTEHKMVTSGSKWRLSGGGSGGGSSVMFEYFEGCSVLLLNVSPV